MLMSKEREPDKALPRAVERTNRRGIGSTTTARESRWRGRLQLSLASSSSGRGRAMFLFWITC